MAKPTTDSTETRITEVQRENTKALNRVYDAISGTETGLRNIRDGVARVSTKVEVLATRMDSFSDLIETKLTLVKTENEKHIGEKIDYIAKYAIEEIEKHAANCSLRKKSRWNAKTISALIGVIVTLSGIIIALVRIL